MNQRALVYFLVTMRVLLDDLDSSVYQYSDAALTAALQSVIQFNKLPGFTLTPDQTAVTPDILNPGTCPDNFAILVLNAVRLMIVGRPDRFEYKTRAMAERFGSFKNFLQTLENDLHLLENGPMFLGWQSYHAWMSGMAGLPIGLMLTNINVRAPFFTANLSTAGVTITPSAPSI